VLAARVCSTHALSGRSENPILRLRRHVVLEVGNSAALLMCYCRRVAAVFACGCALQFRRHALPASWSILASYGSCGICACDQSNQEESSMRFWQSTGPVKVPENTALEPAALCGTCSPMPLRRPASASACVLQWPFDSMALDCEQDGMSFESNILSPGSIPAKQGAWGSKARYSNSGEPGGRVSLPQRPPAHRSPGNQRGELVRGMCARASVVATCRLRDVSSASARWYARTPVGGECLRRARSRTNGASA
jgi:hypothetical protein